MCIVYEMPVRIPFTPTPTRLELNVYILTVNLQNLFVIHISQIVFASVKLHRFYLHWRDDFWYDATLICAPNGFKSTLTPRIHNKSAGTLSQYLRKRIFAMVIFSKDDLSASTIRYSQRVE